MSKAAWFAAMTLFLVLFPGTSTQAVASAFEAGPQSLPTSCEPPAIEGVTLNFTPIGNGAVWTHHSGCHAQITCDSNCQMNCSGDTYCTVGSNYVECDGQKTYCPTCDLQQYPGYPTCGLRQCPWCVCVSNGGTSEDCCNLL